MSKQSSQVKEHPIILDADEVNAILDGLRTQMRLPVKQNVHKFEHGQIIKQSSDKNRIGCAYFFNGDAGGYCEPEQLVKCPYQVGDRLWVRETYFSTRELDVFYKAKGADDTLVNEYAKENGGWKSPVAMPRWASRLTLEITSIRVERLQDISDADAKAEGFDFEPFAGDDRLFKGYGFKSRNTHSFACHWNRKIAKKCYDFGSNPWVWVIEFDVVEGA